MLKKKYIVFILFFLVSCSNINSSNEIKQQYNLSNRNGLSFIKCNIFEELENNQKANEKFKGKQLNIFVNEDEEWINDISKQDWLDENNEIKNKIKTYFKKKDNIMSFFLEKFYTIEKQKIESKDHIKINLQTKLLIFKKIYYDFNQKVFFESTLYGECD